jgi:hypothetical protein
MKRRKMEAGYRGEQRARNQAINRLHGMFLAQGVTDVVKAALRPAGRGVKRLDGLEREELACLELYEARIGVLEKQMEKGISKKNVIVAIARRLSELLNTLMKNGTKYEVRKSKPQKGGGKKLAQIA